MSDGGPSLAGPVRDRGARRLGSRVGVVLAAGFRPFFLLAGLQAAVAVPAWLGVLRGRLPAPGWLAPSAWHAHEMIFGFAAAAIAGFLLTAVPVWTRSRPVAGAPLAALALLWLAGRVAVALAPVLPAPLVAAVDGAFLPALALALARPLLRPDQRHNRGFLLVLIGLALANAVVHLEAIGLWRGVSTRALRVAVDGVVLLVAVVGGRITPAFTRNALQRAGVDAPVRSRPWLDRLAVGAVAALALADVWSPRSATSGLVALLAACAAAARMAGWQSLRAARDPLLWSLHLGLAWMALGLALVAASDLLGVPVPAAGLHALGAGAIGGMVLAVMTRVSLGHTGRPLVALRGVPAAYALVHAGALLRVAGTLAPPALQLGLLTASGLLWASAFALFSVLHAPVLTRPRVDGLPG